MGDFYADWLRERCGLEKTKAPLFAMVTRFVQQKGVDLALGAAETIVEAGGQFFIHQ